MKKIFSSLLGSFMFAIHTLTSAVPVMAAEKDFKTDFLTNGKLQTPEAPYITEDTGNGHTFLTMWHYQPEDMQNLGLVIQQHEEKDDGYFLDEQYGVEQLSKYYQIDVKFNDDPWLSESGDWDTINQEYGTPEYGENINENNLAFLNISYMNNTNADKLISFTQSWLTYFEADNPINDYYKPYVKTRTDDYDVNYFDFSELTISYRIRSCIQYIEVKGEDDREWVLLTSDWSPETSYGKNGKQETLTMPEKIDAPVLSEFNLSANEDGTGDISCFVTLPDSLYQAVRYQLIINNGFEPYYVDAEVKVNDGDWISCYVADSTWFTNGYRSVAPDGEKLKVTDDAWIRVRICNHDNNEPASEWSNIIGTKAVEGEKNAETPDGELTEGTTETHNAEKADCKLCHICPVQPLGICLFIWIAIIVVVLIIIIAVIINAKKKKKKK